MQKTDDFAPVIGLAEEIAPGLRRIVAPNASAMTYRGTNTYVLGHCELAVIDPGPHSDAHLEAILASVGTGQKISHIIVTHSHLDHSPLARALSERCDVPVMAFGNAQAGRSDVMAHLVQSGLRSGGEGVDHAFAPDISLRHEELIEGDDWCLEVIHTPGHLGNHICLGWNDACFTADHVMGWATSLVSPPDGDLTDFMTSCATLQKRVWRIFYPGHGAPVHDPNNRLDWLINHRLERENSIMKVLRRGPSDVAALTKEIYRDTPQALWPAAARNVLAHLIDLYVKSQVEPCGPLTADTSFQISASAQK